MMTHYVQTALQDVKPGMVLSDDLLDQQGHVLLAQGVVLSLSTIDALRRHQVNMVPIVAAEMSLSEDVLEQTRYAERIERLFRKIPADERSAAATLRQYLRDFRMGITV